MNASYMTFASAVDEAKQILENVSLKPHSTGYLRQKRAITEPSNCRKFKLSAGGASELWFVAMASNASGWIFLDLDNVGAKSRLTTKPR